MGIGTPVSLLIGMILILGSVGLFFLDKIKPAYARDSDKVYAVLILLSGLLSLTHWDMGPGLSFQQLLMAGMLTTLLVENVRKRVPTINSVPPQGRPSGPRYEERPPSRRVYRAELDDRFDDRRGAPPGGRGFLGEDRGRPPRMAPPQEPRMMPGGGYRAYRPGERPEAYGEWGADWNRPRQPYEEYRGPVGRLQPSEERPRSEQRGENGRYGARPPAPPEPRPLYPDDKRPDGENGDFRAGQAPSNRPGAGSSGELERPPFSPELGAESGAQPEDFGRRERPLNIRPYNEAARSESRREGPDDGGEFGGYRPDRPEARPDYRPDNRPEGAPS